MSDLELRPCGEPAWLSHQGGESLHRRYELWAAPSAGSGQAPRMIGWIQARSRRRWFHQRSATGFCRDLGEAFDDLMRGLGREERWKDKEWLG